MLTITSNQSSVYIEQYKKGLLLSKKLARKLFIFYLRCNLNLLKFWQMVILALLECLQEKKLLAVSTVLY